MEVKIEFIYDDKTYDVVCSAKEELNSMFKNLSRC